MICDGDRWRGGIRKYRCLQCDLSGTSMSYHHIKQKGYHGNQRAENIVRSFDESRNFTNEEEFMFIEGKNFLIEERGDYRDMQDAVESPFFILLAQNDC